MYVMVNNEDLKAAIAGCQQVVKAMIAAYETAENDHLREGLEWNINFGIDLVERLTAAVVVDDDFGDAYNELAA